MLILEYFHVATITCVWATTTTQSGMKKKLTDGRIKNGFSGMPAGTKVKPSSVQYIFSYVATLMLKGIIYNVYQHRTYICKGVKHSTACKTTCLQSFLLTRVLKNN